METNKRNTSLIKRLAIVFISVTLLMLVILVSINYNFGENIFIKDQVPRDTSQKDIHTDADPLLILQKDKDRLQMLINSAKISPRGNSYVWAENLDEFNVIQNKYAVMSATVPNLETNNNYWFNKRQENEMRHKGPRVWGYIFHIPNTVRAWRRINYEPIVMLAIDSVNMEPKAKILFALVKQQLSILNVATFYFDVPSLMKVRMSQLLRMFPAALDIFRNESYMLTSDADIWPNDPQGFDLPSKKSIHVTNYQCCGSFTYNKKTYQEWPMTTIGMTVRKWIEVLNFQRFLTFDENVRFDYDALYKHLTPFARGNNIYRAGVHGDNLWSLDQLYISVILKDHIDIIGEKEVSLFDEFKCGFVRPGSLTDKWTKGTKFTRCWSRAHVPKDLPWNEDMWKMAQKLINVMYNKTVIDEMNYYRKLFVGAFPTIYDLY